MTRDRFDRTRLTINLANLAASILFIAGAVLVLSGLARLEKGSWIAVIYSPLIEGFAQYNSLGLAGKAAVAAVAALSLASLLIALLFSFKMKIEDWAVMILGMPFYLALAGTVFLAVGFLSSVIGWVLS